MSRELRSPVSSRVSADQRMLLDSLSDPIIIADRENRIVYSNAAIEGLLGWRPGELVGRPLTALLPQPSKAHDFGSGSYASTGVSRVSAQPIRVHANRRDGIRVEVDLALSSVPGGLAVGTLRDPHDRAKLERRDALLELLDTLLETAPAAIGYLDREFRYVYVNEKLAEIHGRPVADHIGRTLREVIPQRADVLEPLYHRILQSGEPSINRHITSENPADPGAIRHWLISNYPVRARSGEITGICVMGTEITEHRRAEEALRKSEGRFEVLAGNIPQLVWISSDEGNVEYFNKPWYDFTGLTLEESTGKGWLRVLHPEDVDRVLTAWNRARTTGQPYEVECRYRRSDGVYRWVLVRALPERDEHGGIRWFGTSTDITERKQAEDALKESEALLKTSESRYRFLAESMPQIVWYSSPDGRVDYCSQTLARYMGKPVDFVYGAGWQAIVHPDDLSRTIDVWSHSLSSGEVYQNELRLQRSDGVYRWFLARSLPMRDASGSITQWFGTLTDIEDLKQFQAELQQAVQVRDDFLTVASHELKTPLAALKLQLQGVQRLSQGKAGIGAPDGAFDRVDKAVRNAERLSRLVDELLDVSRVITGRLRLELEEMDLAEMVREVALRFQEAARTLGSRIQIQAEHASGRWDRTRIEQVVANLLSNALKYGQGKPVELTVFQERGDVVLRVRDYGIGIRPEHQRRIFERFERAVSTRHYGGLGLGLWIVRQVVEAHDGRVAVESGEGKGATFTVWLPREPRLREEPSVGISPDFA